MVSQSLSQFVIPMPNSCTHICSGSEESTDVLEANEAGIGVKIESVPDHSKRFSVNRSSVSDLSHVKRK